MKYKITKNQNSVTLLIMPAFFLSTDYLYEKYGEGEKAYSFATGLIKGDYKAEVAPMIKDLAEKLSEVCEKKLSGEKIIFGNLFGTKDDGNYPLFSFHVDKDGNATPLVAISCRNAGSNGKQYLFNDLAQTSPVDKETAYRNEYAIEIEIKAFYNEKTLSSSVYAIFHRGIKCGIRTDMVDFKPNDNAWAGFDIDVGDDDLPF